MSYGILAILHAFYGVLYSKGRRINWGIALASAWIGLSDSEGTTITLHFPVSAT